MLEDAARETTAARRPFLAKISAKFSLWLKMAEFWLTLAVSEIQPFQESPRQTKPKKGAKRKVHEFRPFL